jgi:hypothetical protein
MFIFGQINIGANAASILGIFYVILAIVQLIFQQKTYRKYLLLQLMCCIPPISFLILIVAIIMGLCKITDKLEFIFFVTFPSFLLLSGSILFFQGWRLDPVLQYKDLLQFVVILYFSIKSLRATNHFSS